MQLNPSPLLSQDTLDPRRDECIQLVAEWVTEHRMHHQSQSSEEGVFSDPLCSVDDLIWDDEMAWSDLFP